MEVIFTQLVYSHQVNQACSANRIKKAYAHEGGQKKIAQGWKMAGAGPARAYTLHMKYRENLSVYIIPYYIF